MIISKLQGGLGNQMFQWAFGKYLSKNYNTPLYLDLNFFKHQNKRNFTLDRFPKLSFETLNYIKDIKNLIIVSDDFNLKEIIIKNDNNYYLDGHWQSEKYFYEIEDTIRNDLSPSDKFFTKISKLPIKSNNVSIHIRRTDYITSNGYHPVQSIDYYKNAIDIIGQYDNLFIISDDIKWCKENLQFDKMIFIEGFDDVEDIWIMSLCNHNIIANSSFSWWGAWLNNHKNKKVIAPRKWFGEQVDLNTSNLIPDKWIII